MPSAWGITKQTNYRLYNNIITHYVSVVRRFKMKVGSDLNDDIRRAAIFREEIGWDNFLVSE